MAGKCAHDDSRLSCVDCGNTICSNCMVECPVGFRCKTCVGGSVPVAGGGVNYLHVARTLAIFAALGFAGGWVLTLVSIPFLTCIIAYFLGLTAGRALSRLIDYRVSGDIGKTITFGLLIGLSLSPYGRLPALALAMIQEAFAGQGSLFNVLLALVSVIFTPAIFYVGVMRPTVWGERW